MFPAYENVRHCLLAAHLLQSSLYLVAIWVEVKLMCCEINLKLLKQGLSLSGVVTGGLREYDYRTGFDHLHDLLQSLFHYISIKYNHVKLTSAKGGGALDCLSSSSLSDFSTWP